MNKPRLRAVHAGMHQLHERLSAQAEHFENSGPEDDNLQKGTDRAVFAGLLRRAAEIVQTHETGSRIAEGYDPLGGTFTSREVKGCAPVQFERSPGGNVTMAPQVVQGLHDRIAELEHEVAAQRAGAKFSLQAVAAQDAAWNVASDLDRLMATEGITREMRDTEGSTANFMDKAARALRQAAMVIEANGLARMPVERADAPLSERLTIRARSLLNTMVLAAAAGRPIDQLSSQELTAALAVMGEAARALAEPR